MWPLGGSRAVCLPLRLLLLELVELATAVLVSITVRLLRITVQAVRALRLVRLLQALARRVGGLLPRERVRAPLCSVLHALFDHVADFPLVCRFHTEWQAMIARRLRVLLEGARVVREPGSVPLLVID